MTIPFDLSVEHTLYWLAFIAMGYVLTVKWWHWMLFTQLGVRRGRKNERLRRFTIATSIILAPPFAAASFVIYVIYVLLVGLIMPIIRPILRALARITALLDNYGTNVFKMSRPVNRPRPINRL